MADDATKLAAFAALEVEPIRPERQPDGRYHVRVCPDGDGRWTSIHTPAESPGDDLATMVLSARDRLVALREAREAAQAANVEDYLSRGKLRRVSEGWEAQRRDGTWTDPQATPRAAVREAMGQ